MKKYYHATQMKNLVSILEEGLKPGCDGIVYLAEKPEDAVKFVWVRCTGPADILVIEIELKENEVEETFDHNQNFFGCRAFGYPGVITANKMVDFRKFEKR